MSFSLDDLHKPSDITCTRDIFEQADHLLAGFSYGQYSVDILRQRLDEVESIVPRVRNAALGILEAAERLHCSAQLNVVVQTALKSDDFAVRGMGERVREILEGERRSFHDECRATQRAGGQLSHCLNNQLSILDNNAGFIADAYQMQGSDVSGVYSPLAVADAAHDLRRSMRDMTALTRSLAMIYGASSTRRSENDYITELKPAVTAAGIERLDVFFHGPEDMQGVFNPSQAHEALKHLLVNAADAAEDTTKPCRVDVYLAEVLLNEAEASVFGLEPGKYVKMTVQDYGPGISEEEQMSVLKPFYTTRTDIRHLGLGLTYAAIVVHNHEGAIHIDSRTGDNSYTAVTLFFANPEPTAQK